MTRRLLILLALLALAVPAAAQVTTVPGRLPAFCAAGQVPTWSTTTKRWVCAPNVTIDPVTGAVTLSADQLLANAISLSGKTSAGVTKKLIGVTAGDKVSIDADGLGTTFGGAVGIGTTDLTGGHALKILGRIYSTDLQLSGGVVGDLLAKTDATSDLGGVASGRFRDFHLARDAVVGGTITLPTLTGTGIRAIGVDATGKIVVM
jgi:hypothetical protein